MPSLLSLVLQPQAMTLLVAGLTAGQPVVPTLPLSIAVADVEGAPVQTTAWVDGQLSEAQRLYNEIGVYFRKAKVRKLDASLGWLENRKDRDALAGHLDRGFINVFIVASLRDVDDPKLFRMGVHWAPNGDLKRQLIIVSAAARKTTMAHEIGHYFGLQHTSTPDNLMSYSRTGAEVFMSLDQKSKVVTNAKVAVSRKELLP